MLNLPLCDKRGEEGATGLYFCSSAWVLSSSGMVSGEFCKRCPYANKPNPLGQQWWAKLLFRWRWATWKGYRGRERLLAMKNATVSCLSCTPSLAMQALAFAKAAAKHVANGCPTVTEEQYQERLRICQGCEFFDQRALKCLKCGCSADGQLLNKLRWGGEKCPVGKWGSV